MNVNNHDDSSSVEDVEGAEDAENAAESDDESVSLLEMNEPSSSLLDVYGGNVSWTTYSTNFKPTQETRQAKQDLNKKNQVDNLVKYMNQK
jgi:hypothetical protein